MPKERVPKGHHVPLAVVAPAACILPTQPSIGEMVDRRVRHHVLPLSRRIEQEGGEGYDVGRVERDAVETVGEPKRRPARLVARTQVSNSVRTCVSK